MCKTLSALLRNTLNIIRAVNSLPVIPIVLYSFWKFGRLENIQNFPEIISVPLKNTLQAPLLFLWCNSNVLSKLVILSLTDNCFCEIK